MRPWCVDLFCGSGGATKGFLAAGYRVTGIDIERHPDYPAEAEFIQADVLDIRGGQFRGAHFMWASPPCQEFSRHAMPWTRARNPPPPDMSLVQAAYRLRREAEPTWFVLENVRAAQDFLGRAPWHRAGRFLRGDILLAPHVRSRPKESYWSTDVALRSEIPFDLSHGIAMAALASYQPELTKAYRS